MVVILYHNYTIECEGRFLESLVLSVLSLVLKYGGSQMKNETPLAAARRFLCLTVCLSITVRFTHT